ncbi:hypothetical protein HanXRQr2_Chr12g0530121 [Helianthus annuus]|uniref:Uncharacterized protein n=1 Tax=Helianthus annuus TaxID=4232 RepID=A0A251T3C2_HELAN|nr:hypothetical protein HanXRQr2_Chr12g0530121 [Helianthus annuus]KAJ0492137.1 hypothetical protein HanIR_Chr12g0571441 [Helianthus annuus]KAJ0504435.1 hypothetical protein HanHA89_Chr12g0459241 [Helianthus annuus]KAJ0674151.1 hypothetical protein HanLR1_Chr12g0436761 [Helianthus annuus]KAJ0861806.1 hypothetical protein HanPSC8_Chr12g0510781 [Helianthus annuus]
MLSESHLQSQHNPQTQPNHLTLLQIDPVFRLITNRNHPFTYKRERERTEGDPAMAYGRPPTVFR